MERVLSQEERIRRAEELYYRRKLNNNEVKMSGIQSNDKTEKSQFSLYRKLAIQILVCILIYLIISLIQEANYLFSENVINKTKEFLNQDINFETISTNVNEFWQKNKEKFNIFQNSDTQNINEQNTEEQNEEENNSNDVNNNEINNNELNNNTTNNNESNQVEDDKANTENNTNNQTTGIGGASSTENEETDEEVKKTQMEIDAEYIKANFEMQLPVKATVTSGYGSREETEIVSAEHYGIDLGVVEGTTIVAAMAGTVSLVSNEGEYGTHIKIVNEDVTTIYAHCSKILVKEGETIKMGQKIALSGNTGNTTGPHLHFEIRRENRTIDPALVLKF